MTITSPIERTAAGAELSGYGPTPVDPASMRRVLANFATGVTIITAHDGTRPVGFTCQSVTSLSLDPPYVLFCPGKGSTSWPGMRATGEVCINVLADDQEHLCGQFARRGADKFAGVDWSYGDNDAPVLAGALATIQCTLEFEHDAGDHTIAVCRVTGLGSGRDGDPLLFFRGGFGRFADETPR